MKRILFVLFLIFNCLPFLFAQNSNYEVAGGNGQPYLIESKNNYEVYLLNGLQGARITFTSSTSHPHQWYKYRTQGSDAVTVSCTQTSGSNTSYISDIEDGWCYYVGNDIKTSYIWIIDYSQHMPTIHSFETLADEFECEQLLLITNLQEDNLYYNTHSGQRIPINREYNLHYNELQWKEEFLTYDEVAKDSIINFVSQIELNPPPYMDTEFTLTDMIAKRFGIEITKKTPLYKAIALDWHVVNLSGKEQEETQDGEPATSSAESAPYSVEFEVYANEPVANMFIWTIAKRQTGGNTQTIRQALERKISHTFMEEGEYEVRLSVFGDNCEIDTLVQNVIIGATELKVPNFFSPGNSSGMISEFKVTYKSISNFKCSIYNRWGNLLYVWTDPSQGWDGRVNGRFVATGAYPYVIEYTNSKGNKKTKSGFVNILREGEGSSSSTGIN